LIVFGVLGIILSFAADFLPGAKAGIQSAQILGIEIAIGVGLTGVWILLAETNEKIHIGKRMQDLFDQILNLPVLVWALAGFLLTYLLFFITPVFLNATLRMHYLTTYLPDRYPIGNDMILLIDLAKGWFLNGQSPYDIQFYPPLTYVFFAPLLLVNNYPTLFRIFTFMTLGSYIFLTLLIPAKISGREKTALIMLFFITGLFSYGLQFELERGQYNVFAFLPCMLSIYIFHYHPRYRVFAYILFSLSVQLKLYPAIFIVMLVDDWRNWKTILARFIGIGTFNFILLFAMGYEIFREFIGSVFTQLTSPSQAWNGNHSIKSFVDTMTVDGFKLVEPDTLALLRQSDVLIANILLLMTLTCIISAVWIFHLRREGGLDTYLFLACTIGALTIPVSNDYTLSILAAPMALFLSNLAEMKRPRDRFISIFLIVGLSVGYSSMLVPFKYKPYFMNNAFPALLIILIILTFLNFMRYKTVEGEGLV